MLLRYLLLIVVSFSLNGCSLSNVAETTTPTFHIRSCILECAAELQNLNKVYLISLGWHSGIIISNDDLKESKLYSFFFNTPIEYLEFGWGDRDFYMADDYSIWKAFKAAFFSSSSVLHVVGFSEMEKIRHINQHQVIKLWLTKEGFNSLIDFIYSSLVLDQQNKPVQLESGLYGNSLFFAAKGNFSLLYTCNSWSAEALQTAGCPINRNQRRVSSLFSAIKRHAHICSINL